MATGHSTLVVVESGAGSLSFGPHARVVVQSDEELPGSFASRVRSDIDGDALQRVVILAGPTHDFARIASRAQMAQQAAAHLASSGGGSLVLAASDPRGELAQRALGEILRDQLGATVSVSVRDVDTMSFPAFATPTFTAPTFTTPTFTAPTFTAPGFAASVPAPIDVALPSAA